VLAVIAVAVLTARLLDPARTAMAGGVLTVAVIAAGWPLANADLHGRYAAGSTDVTAAFARFRDTQDLRIGVGGFADLYPLYGLALDNEVQYVGFTEPAGGFHAPLTCAAWRTALGAGRYEYVVISRSPVASQTIPRETRWTAGDPAAHLVLRRGVTSVFRLTGRPDPAGCAGHPISSGPWAPPPTGT
jgi:hypothetical protein